MRSKSRELMKAICQYAEQYYLQTGISPSTTKIADAVGVSRGTAYKYLVAMNDNGMIEYDGKNIHTDVTKKLNTENSQTDVTRKFNTETSQTAIVGSVPCGSLQYEEENIEEYISLPTAIFGKGDFYILHASGNSMIDAGIDDGDLVVIRKQNYARDGDIVVALVENQNTLKTFYRDEQSRKIILHPENKSMDDIVVDDCYIQGIACHVIKAL